MSVVTGLIKLFFGTKSEKDRKAIQPYVDKIKAIYPSIEQLTVDELRARSAGLKAAIAEYISAEEQQIAELKVQLENLDTSLDDKERISKQIDTLTEEIDRKIEEKLDEIMPEAFSIMKETARRFKENEEIVVTAHSRKYNHVKGTQFSGRRNVPDCFTAFHDYALEWDEYAWRGYIDGQLVYVFRNEGKGFESWPFDQRFHLILNLAIGGNWGGSRGIDPTGFPKSMEVDYVRVYQRK